MQTTTGKIKKESSVQIRRYQPRDFDQVLELLGEGGLEPWTSGYRRSWNGDSSVVTTMLHGLVPLAAYGLSELNGVLALVALTLYELLVAGYIRYLFWEDKYKKNPKTINRGLELKGTWIYNRVAMEEDLKRNPSLEHWLSGSKCFYVATGTGPDDSLVLGTMAYAVGENGKTLR